LDGSVSVLESRGENKHIQNVSRIWDWKTDRQAYIWSTGLGCEDGLQLRAPED
jgi:hypothetical protein